MLAYQTAWRNAAHGGEDFVSVPRAYADADGFSRPSMVAFYVPVREQDGTKKSVFAKTNRRNY